MVAALRSVVYPNLRSRIPGEQHLWLGDGTSNGGNAVLECWFLGGWNDQGADAPRSPGGEVFNNLAKNTQRWLASANCNVYNCVITWRHSARGLPPPRVAGSFPTGLW